MKWFLDFQDLSMYGNYHPPTLPEHFLLVECFNPEQCATYAQHLLTRHSELSGVHALDGSAMVDTYHRSSKYIQAPGIEQAVAERLTWVINYHVYGRIGRRLKLAEPVQFLRYDAADNGHFLQHTDDGFMRDGVWHYTAPQRKFATITYLNEDYVGGHLVLPTLRDDRGIPFNCKMHAGSMIIFPSDQRYPHEVKPVTEGVRLAVVAWFDFDNSAFSVQPPA